MTSTHTVAEALHAYLETARWFGGKGRGFQVVDVRRAGLLTNGTDGTGEQPDETAHFGALRGVGDRALRVVDEVGVRGHRRQPALRAETRVEGVEGRGAGGIDEHAVDLRHRVVAGRPGRGPPAGQLLAVLEAGAEEVNDLGDGFEIVSEATDLVAVRTALQEAGIDYDSADPTFLPSMQVPLDVDGARRMIRVIDALEDSDDVQDVFANGDISDEVLAELDA